MNKLIKLCIGLGLLGASTAISTNADAADQRPIPTHEIHLFTKQLEDAFSTENIEFGIHLLDDSISDTAKFEDRKILVKSVNPSTVAWGAYYGTPYNSPYNTVEWRSDRYGYAAYAYPRVTTHVGIQQDTKQDFINRIEVKKRQLPGYQASFDIKEIHADAFGDGVIAYVDFNESSYAYTARDRQLMDRIVHSRSLCQMHLKEADTRHIVIERMTCQRTSTLPM